MINIVYGAVEETKGHAIELLLKIIKEIEGHVQPESFSGEDTFFTGYPLLDAPEGIVRLDALLLSKKYGIIAIDIICDESKIFIQQVRNRQDFIYNQLISKLAVYKELTKGRGLAFSIHLITINFFDRVKHGDAPEDSANILIASDDKSFYGIVNKLEETNLEQEIFKKLKQVLQGVTRLRPIKKRVKVKNKESKGNKIKEIEKQISNLDIYQNKAIVETTNGPQRITGLAGTGKTVVLAGKVAYLHALYPDLEIAVTFYSRSLYQQYRELIRRLYFDHASDEPNWEKIHLLHAWGSPRTLGLYYVIAEKNKLETYTYNDALNKFGAVNPFVNCCDELLKQLRNPEKVFDVILIDEAQDMPRSFFEICYISTPEPHRVIWAYDQLQQINLIESVPPPEVLFGKDKEGKERYRFKEDLEGPEDDIVLKVCYRNPKEIIATAHALGLAVYYNGGPIQMIEDKYTWERIGYTVYGQLLPNKKVVIERAEDASPTFLKEYLETKDIVNFYHFKNVDDQAEWIANEIEKNINVDELEHTDILVIYPEPLDLRSATGKLRAILASKGIKNHIAGAADASEYFIEDSITISHIHRAKGNEAAIVYIMNSDTCFTGTELIRKRNILFTAISRARAWVRICGIGERMASLIKEIEKIKVNNYRLEFTFPKDLEKRRTLHREFTYKEKIRKKGLLDNIAKLREALQKGEIDPGDLSVAELEKLRKLLFRD